MHVCVCECVHLSVVIQWLYHDPLNHFQHSNILLLICFLREKACVKVCNNKSVNIHFTTIVVIFVYAVGYWCFLCICIYTYIFIYTQLFFHMLVYIIILSTLYLYLINYVFPVVNCLVFSISVKYVKKWKWSGGKNRVRFHVCLHIFVQ